ncbi:heterokaryon incompatibility protein [Fusarium pseudoanthophilum]|uniref:Heterokaryon incompatibility protein n=1 Tax=Fusarium pseudoanthophilum TaxID=48495 RepID=A0A8H5V0I5_9HYPO|nr:heterokaryon incompatibility protein [Fusarium pseudoanthophilum]
MLQTGLEAVENSLHTDCQYHSTFSSFKQAVDNGCYICAKLWDSVADASIKSWSNEPGTWVPFDCSLGRRSWAPRWYGAIYWHMRYLEFEMDPQVSFKYKGNVFCFLPCQDEQSSMLQERAVDFQASTSSEEVHQLASEWHKACSDSHKLCQRLRSSKFAPSRLIDISSGDTWKLCLYPQDITDPPEYMTLSYRWAKTPSIRLLSSNVEVFRKGTSIAQFPKTFREAIIVARRFSIRYLWIDSLCIIQDSPEDWARESLQMHLVYANSACTISATASESPDEGLFRLRTARETLIGHIKVQFADGNPRGFDLWDQHHMQRLTQGPLTDRGWVFQERILSPRVLHFAKTQIVWECVEMNKSEMFPRWSPQPTDAVYTPDLKAIDAFFDDGHRRTAWAKEEDKKMTVDVYQQWINLVKTYSGCSLTYPDDRLMAMAGIAEMFRKNSGDEYLAGLWRSRIVEGLNWVVLEPGPRPQDPERVPSWSWAAVDTCVLPQRTNLPRDEDLIEVIDVRTHIAQSSSRSQKLKGFIELRGCISGGTVGESSRSIGAEHTVLKLLEISSTIYAYPDTIESTFQAGESISFLPLRSTLRREVKDPDENPVGEAFLIIEGLILEAVCGARSTYKRVGHFVLVSLGHASFFGLVATLPTSRRGVARISTDESRKSIITLV